jgi:predicted RNA-binding Zn-ribbon protein involved in translation (DUF1610 family)
MNKKQTDYARLQRTGMGAKMVGQRIGAKGSGGMMSKALDKVAQGGALPANLAQQISPFAKSLEIILADPQLRNKFMILLKQAQSSEKKAATTQSVGAESVREGLGELANMAEKDHEVQMARADLYKIAKYAIKLHEMLKNVSEAEGIEGWQQAKITKAADYIGSVYHSLDYEMKFGEGQVTENKKGLTVKEGADFDCPNCGDYLGKASEVGPMAFCGRCGWSGKTRKVAEGLDSEQKQRLNDLIDAYRDATDPDAYEYVDPDDIVDQIRQQFGDKIADTISQGPSMHYPRPGYDTGYDRLANKSSPRVTKSGKINRQDAEFMKRNIKQKLGRTNKSTEVDDYKEGLRQNLSRKLKRKNT